MTDTSNPPDNDSNKPTEEISPEESADEEQYDDPDYTTASYMEFVKNPPYCRTRTKVRSDNSGMI
jgi:hypothetical protein